MGGSGFIGGVVQGMQQAQDRQMQFQELKLRQDLAKTRMKSMELEDQEKAMNIQALQRKMQAQAQLPGQISEAMGPQSAPLGVTDFGPVAPEPNRTELASILTAAQSHGVDWKDMMSTMAIGDPRLKPILDSLQPEKVIEVEPGKSVIGIKPGQKEPREIFKAPAAPAKPPDFGDRLESAAAAYGQNKYGKPTTFTELLGFDPIQASVLRQTVMVDEPTEIAAGKLAATIPERKAEVLTPSEANELGVPFGTTKGQAEGIMPMTAQQRSAIASFDTARTIIADIKQYSEKVNTASAGLKGRAAQSMKLWGAWMQSDPDAAMLQSKAGELASIARSMGEKGALADKDVARAAALIPGVMDTREIAQKKLRDMSNIIDQGEASLRKSLGIDARAQGTSKKAVPPPKPADPLSHIQVPAGLSPKQEQFYREAYAAHKAKKQQQMKPKATTP